MDAHHVQCMCWEQEASGAECLGVFVVLLDTLLVIPRADASLPTATTWALSL